MTMDETCYSPGNSLGSNLDWSKAGMVWWFLVAAKETKQTKS